MSYSRRHCKNKYANKKAKKLRQFRKAYVEDDLNWRSYYITLPEPKFSAMKVYLVPKNKKDLVLAEVVNALTPKLYFETGSPFSRAFNSSTFSLTQSRFEGLPDIFRVRLFTSNQLDEQRIQLMKRIECWQWNKLSKKAQEYFVHCSETNFMGWAEDYYMLKETIPRASLKLECEPVYKTKEWVGSSLDTTEHSYYKNHWQLSEYKTYLAFHNKKGIRLNERDWNVRRINNIKQTAEDEIKDYLKYGEEEIEDDSI